MSDFQLTTTKSSAIALASLMAVMTTSHATNLPEYKIEKYHNKFSSSSGSFLDLSLKDAANDNVIKAAKAKLAINECPNYIKSTFGLNITDLSKVLGVSRPTAYKYIDGDIPHGDNSELIEKLYELASYWESKAEGMKLGMEFKRKYKKNSLYQLMMEKEFELARNLIDDIAVVVSARKSRSSEGLKTSMHGEFNPDMTRTSIKS